MLHDHQLAPTPYEQLLPSGLREHAALLWSMGHAVLAGLAALVTARYEGIAYAGSAVALTAIAVLLPPTVSWVRSIFLNLTQPLSTFVEWSPDKIEAWLRAHARRSLVGGPFMWLAGLVNMLLALLTLMRMGTPYRDPLIEVFVVTSLAPLFFFCGTSAYNFAVFLSFPYNVARLPIRLTTYHDRYYGATSLKPFIFRVSFVALGYYLLLFAAVWFGPYPVKSAMAVWLSAIGATVILVFPLSVWTLHRVLRESKSEALRRVAELVEKQVEATLESPNADNLSQTAALFALRDNLRSLPTWPIDFKTVIAAITTVLFPIAAILIDVMRE